MTALIDQKYLQQ